MENKKGFLKYFYSIILLFFLTAINAQNLDISVLRDININRNKALDPTFKTLTNSAIIISNATPIFIYAVGLIKKDSLIKKKGLLIGETFIASAFITIALKNAIKRDRPFVTYPEIEQQTSAGPLSFPSGHTSSAFATATSLSLAYPKWYVIAPSFLWAGTVGYSRMHLGVHYPSDVLAGALIGIGSAYLGNEMNKWINKRKKATKIVIIKGL